MKNMLSLICGALALLPLAAFAVGSGPQFERFDQMIQQQYVAPFKAGDAKAWLQVYADDAVALHNRRPADVGKPAIDKFVSLVTGYFRADEFTVTLQDVRIDGDLAITRGVYASRLVTRAEGKEAPWGREEGKFLFVWKQQGDGSWKIIYDMGNSSGDSPAAK
jgi:ketosteroid isomerase-like protein